MQTKNSSAPKIREIAKEFLIQHRGVEVKRKEIEDYIDNQIEVTPGSKTGALNRLLISDGIENGIKQVGRGLYIYDPNNETEVRTENIEVEQESIDDQLIRIMNTAFEDAKKVINNIEIVDMLTKEDLDKLSYYRDLLNIKNDIDKILEQL